MTYKMRYRRHRLRRAILRGAADYFLTGCTSTIEPLRAMGIRPERIGIVHYGVDETVSHPQPGLKGPRTILFVGALQEHKGGIMLLQAPRHLRRPARVVLLTISRDLAYEEKITRLLREEMARQVHAIEHPPPTCATKRSWCGATRRQRCSPRHRWSRSPSW